MTRGRDTSRELTEIRTVLGRAETALKTLRGLGVLQEVGAYVQDDDHGFWHLTRVAYTPDPDIDDMIEALEQTIASIKHWRKTGTATKNVNLPEGARG